jgi:RNA-binding protein
MKSRIRVGTILHKSSSSGNLILRAETEARIGDVVRNSDGRKIGVIFDLFGPVSKPLVAVKPSIGNPEGLLNEVLYLVRNTR